MADLKHYGNTVKVLVTSIKEPKDKEEQEKFFQQQAAIAEMIHPNIARYYAIFDHGTYIIDELVIISAEIVLNSHEATSLIQPLQILSMKNNTNSKNNTPHYGNSLWHSKRSWTFTLSFLV